MLRGIVSLTPHLVAGRETAVAPPFLVVVVAAESRFQLLDARDLAAAVGEDRGADAKRHLIDDRLVEDGFLTDFQDVRLQHGIAVPVAVGAESRSGEIPLTEVFRRDGLFDDDISGGYFLVYDFIVFPNGLVEVVAELFAIPFVRIVRMAGFDFFVDEGFGIGIRLRLGILLPEQQVTILLGEPFEQGVIGMRM